MPDKELLLAYLVQESERVKYRGYVRRRLSGGNIFNIRDAHAPALPLQRRQNDMANDARAFCQSAK